MLLGQRTTTDRGIDGQSIDQELGSSQSKTIKIVEIVEEVDKATKPVLNFLHLLFSALNSCNSEVMQSCIYGMQVTREVNF